LNQALQLADLLSVAFNTTTGIPVNDLLFQAPKPVQTSETTNGIATIGTLVLEWTRLSDKTGITKYAEYAQKAQAYLLKPQPASGEPFPGLLGTNVLISDGTFTDSQGGWGGGDDSFYEYLIKMYLYDESRFGVYKDRWVAAIDSSIKYIASHPTSRPDLTFLAGWYNSEELYFGSGHRK
jgi:mannosyl-oligosaccharide alpha-1,2-mannosidase